MEAYLRRKKKSKSTVMCAGLVCTNKRKAGNGREKRVAVMERERKQKVELGEEERKEWRADNMESR